MARSPTLAALCLTLGLGGCISTTAPPPGFALLPTEQWTSRIPIEESPVTLGLVQHDVGLSETQRAALSDLANQWRTDNGGIVSVFFPGIGPAPSIAALQAADALRALGIPDVRVGPGGQGVQAGVINVQYTRAEAVLPICGRQIDDYMATRKNTVDTNFGCAVTSNLAAQAADPRDLKRPRAEDPADGARAAVVVGKYQQGQDTGSAIPAGFGSGQSKAVN